MNSLVNKPRQLSFSFRSLVAREPQLWLLYQPYLSWAKLKLIAVGENPQERIITSDTELVIDGFQGSANTFATVAFQLCQKHPVKLAHHLHAPTQTIQAIEKNIPVLLTIREPLDAVVSLTSRWSYISPTQGLKSYIGFYQKLEPYRSNYVLSTFEQTTKHLDDVIETVNAKFNTNFDLVDVEKANTELRKKVNTDEKEINRKTIKQQKKQELTTTKNVGLLEKANSLYQKYLNRY